ncbi:unnamed protein product [Symbiodinium sp. CCMP2456]|nr:unnamed protein product [Symbiodinium sp. CCMP2456]
MVHLDHALCIALKPRSGHPWLRGLPEDRGCQDRLHQPAEGQLVGAQLPPAHQHRHFHHGHFCKPRVHGRGLPAPPGNRRRT